MSLDIIQPPCPPDYVSLVEHAGRCICECEHPLNRKDFFRYLQNICAQMREQGIGLEIPTPEQAEAMLVKPQRPQ